MEYVFTNNAKSLLAVAMGGASTSCQVTSGEGSLFPTPVSGSKQFVIQVAQGNQKAYMTCTARSSDVMTVTRADSYSFAVGSTVKLVLNATVLDNFLQKGVYRTNAGSPNGTLTAAYNGEEVLDTTNNIWYKACPSGTVWKAMNGS